MKKIITAIGITAAGVAAMLSAGTAYAQTNVEQCTYDRDTNVAVVSGTAGSEEVTLSVRDDNNVFYESQQSTDGGSFKFTFQLKGDALTNYTVIVGSTDDASVTEAMTYYGNEVSEIFTKLNEYASANNLSAFQELLTNSLDVMGLELSQEELSAIPSMASVIMEKAPFEKVNDMKSAFDTAKYLYDLSAISDKKVLNGIIKSNKDRYTAKYSDIYNVYANLTEERQEQICENIIGAVNHKVVTEETFNDIFAVQTMRNAIKSAAGWAAARDVIEQTKTELQITAKTLTTESSVYIKMMNSDYSAISDFNNVYIKSLKEVTDSKNNTSSGNSGSGSSGGSSSSGKGSGSGNGGMTSFVPTSPAATETKKTKFTDINNIAWAKEAIESLAEAKIISGRDAETFAPNSPVLREEFIKMLVLVFDMNVKASDTHFGDVADDAWYASYVDTAKDNDIVSGMDDNTFGVGRNITRQDMVAITYRAMQKYNLTNQTSDDEEIDSFSDDADISNYARDGVYCLKNLKIVSGRNDGSFDPQADISRAEAAKILYSVRNLKLAHDYVTEEKSE